MGVCALVCVWMCVCVCKFLYVSVCVHVCVHAFVCFVKQELWGPKVSAYYSKIFLLLWKLLFFTNTIQKNILFIINA